MAETISGPADEPEDFHSIDPYATRPVFQGEYVPPPPSPPPQYNDEDGESPSEPPWADGTRPRYGDYELIREIGRGGMGVVHEAWDVQLKRYVALKLIGARSAGTNSGIERFLVEARAVARLHSHPNIVKIYRVGEQDGEHYLAMQLIRGGSLKDSLDEIKADPMKVADLMEQVADAIAHAHKQGILHLDLKPDNVLMDEKGTPYVTDFGLARKVEPSHAGDMTIASPSGSGSRRKGETPSGAARASSSNTTPTGTGEILGTPSYMSPEQAQGKSVDFSTLSDVYGLGSTLYALLTGERPFEGRGGGVSQILKDVVALPAPSPRDANPRVSRDLDAICLKAMSKAPEARYESARAFARDIKRFREGKPVHARDVGVLEHALRWVQREPMKASAIGLMSMLLLMAAGLGLQVWKDGKVADSEKRAHQASTVATLNAAGTLFDRMLDVFEGEMGSDPQQVEQLTKIRSHALEFYTKEVIEKHKDDKADDVASRLALAKAYERAADLAKKISSGRMKEAKEDFESAIAILKALWARENVAARMEIGAALADAEHAFGEMLSESGDPTQALEHYTAGKVVREALCEKCPKHNGTTACGCEGDSHIRMGLGRSHGYIGDVHRGAGRIKEATEAYLTSHSIRQKLHDDLKADKELGPEMTIQLARSYGNLAWLARHDGKLDGPDGAIAYEETGCQLLTELLAGSLDEATRRKAKEDLAYDRRSIAEFHLEGGMFDKAKSTAREASKLYKELAAERPGTASFRIDLAITELVAASASLDPKGYGTAEAAEGVRAADRLLETARDFTGDTDYRRAKARSKTLTGRLLLQKGSSEAVQAENSLTTARDELDALLAHDPANGDYRSDRAEVNWLLSQARHARGDDEGAAKVLEFAEKEQAKVLVLEPKVRLFVDRSAHMNTQKERGEPAAK